MKVNQQPFEASAGRLIRFEPLERLSFDRLMNCLRIGGSGESLPKSVNLNSAIKTVEFRSRFGGPALPKYGSALKCLKDRSIRKFYFY